MRITIGASGDKTQSAFAVYLRTGQRLFSRDEIEVKFNPWHDPEDGRFTFAGQGIYFGRVSATPRKADTGNGKRGQAGWRVRTKQYDRFDPLNPANHSIHFVRRGETLTAIAARRKGVTVDDLAWLNGVRADAPLRIGQPIKLPTQAYLDAGRDAKNNILALRFYMQTHGGRLPPNVAKAPSLDEQFKTIVKRERKNGYGFDIDVLRRTQLAGGTLVLDSSEGRSKYNQAQAGRPDRLPSDDGGHFIGVRFNGPRDKFNHFAQESNFNRGRYKAMENGWARALADGKRVVVSIDPEYEGASRRPYKVIVTWTINGGKWRKTFLNQKEK